jgi:cyclopropane fatty-acyl-phospholipid synthase-like methyltransferase
MKVEERHHPEYGDPAAHNRHIERYERAAELAMKHGVEKDAVWLDMGCGYGYGTALLAERTKANLVVGIDPDEGATLYAAGNYHGMHTIFMNADAKDAAEWFPARFDGVICIEVLEHMGHDDQDDFLRNLRAVMAPGGVMILTCPIGHGPNPDNPWHIHEPTEFELKTILYEAGFHTERIELMDYTSTSGPGTQATVVCK